MSAHVSGELAFQLVDTAGELADATHELGGDAHARAVLKRAEPTSDAFQTACSVNVAGWDAGLKLGAQIDEVPAQPVDDARALGDKVLAVVTQQPDLKRLLVEKRRREPLDPLAQHGASDRSRIDLVRLAGFALPAPRDPHHLRRDANDVLTRAQQRPLQAARDAPAVLKRPDALDRRRSRPPQRSPLPVVVGSDLELSDHHAGLGIDCCQSVRALVGIRSDHDHVHVPFIGLAAEADRQRTQLSRGDATLLSSHAGDPDRRRATEPKEVSHDGRQPALESARRRTRTTGPAGRLRPRPR